MSRSVRPVAVFLTILYVSSLSARAAGPPPSDTAVSRPEMAIPNVRVITQDGKPVEFYRDLIQGKVVAINFIFTTCTTICPPLGAMFAGLQKENQSRLGKDLYLISVSMDPAVDTPPRLKAWGQKFGASPAWTLITGEKDDITKILEGLSVYTPRFQDHQPITLIGNDATGTWRRAYGFPSTDKLTAMVNEVSQSEDRP